VQGVLQLQGRARVTCQRRQRADALVRDVSGRRDVALGHQPGRRRVERRADQQRVTGLAGQAHRAPGGFGRMRAGQAGDLGLGGADRGGRARVAAGGAPRLSEQQAIPPPAG
jgi:hypothetical protein